MTLFSLLDRPLQRILKRRAQRKFRAAGPFVARGARVLDIGCGEGHVGAIAAAAGAHVTGLDCRRACRAALPFIVADAGRLPFADDAFDVGLLAYVLHHARNPDAVVREAVRTCRCVVVWESLATSRAGTALLEFLDRRANALRGVPCEALHIDRSEGWIRRFRSAGAVLTHQHVLGRFVHRHDLLVFERMDEAVRGSP